MQRDMTKVASPKTASVVSKKRNGVITIVNSQKNGKRVEILEPLYQVLNFGDCIKLGFYENTILVAPEKANLQLPVYHLKKVGKKKVLYSSGLVAEIAGTLGLDFSEKVSITLNNVEVENYCDVDIAFISA